MREADRLLAQPEVQLSAGAQRPPVPHPSKIPACMLELRRWVCWRYENRHGKPTKVPVQPNGALAKPNDAATWWSFHECMTAADAFGFGVGFMLGDGIVGVDLDHVRDPQTGRIEPWAKEVIDELASYAEVSVSGKGVHILCRGALPPGRRRKGPIEMYDRARFFCMTGWRLNDCDLAECTAGLARLHRRIFGDGRNGRGASVARDLGLDDQELIRRACAAKDGIRFKRLWGGDWKGDYPSQSEADLALCSLLAFWTGGDIARIDRLFRMSGLMREKWERADYRQATIEAALSGVREHYSPHTESRNGHPPQPAQISAGAEDRFLKFPLTDSGNAERLVLRHGADIRYCHPQKTWYTWDGRRWTPDRNGHVMDLAKTVARELYEAAWEITDPDRKKQLALWALRSESTDKKKAALVSAQSEPGIPILPEQFDADPFLLNCLNGILDLRTGELRPHRREDYCTRMAPVRYDPGARSELWERFLEEACGGDRRLIDFLQRAAGYSLTGCTSEEVLFIVLGPAASGKSTFLEAIKTSLGDYSRTADFESFVQRRDAGGIRNDIAELAGRRFVVSIEVDDGRRLAESLVKAITGSDTVRARFLYQESFEFVPQFKLWLSANYAPKVKHDDTGMWRRILRIPFEHVIPPHRRDPSLKARLKDVEVSGPAILAWAVEGCLRWQEDGLDVPDAIRQVTEQYRLEMDPLRDFVADCCVLAPHAWTPAAKLREAYERYSKETGEQDLLNAKEFAAALRARGCEAQKGAKGIRGWRGVGLITEGD